MGPQGQSGGKLMITGSCLCGAVQWRFKGQPTHATACNCTLCRRYGVLWGYDYEGAKISIHGATTRFVRTDQEEPALSLHFCPTCGCLICWRALEADPELGTRIAVNLRLAEPGDVAAIPIRRFDGLGHFVPLEPDGRTVADYWW